MAIGPYFTIINKLYVFTFFIFNKYLIKKYKMNKEKIPNSFNILKNAKVEYVSLFEKIISFKILVALSISLFSFWDCNPSNDNFLSPLYFFSS